VNGVRDVLGCVELRGRTDLLVVIRPSTEIEELVEDRSEGTSCERADVPDPRVLPVVGDELRAERLPDKVTLRLEPGDVVRILTPGGGGWGPARS